MPAELRKAMDRTLNHAKNTKGEKHEHEKLIDALKKLDNENLALKLEKCKFFQTEVNWLGHKFTPESITPKVTKTEAILRLQHPKSLKQLRSFMGSINHLSKFIPNAASLIDQFRPLLREENEKKMKNVKLPVKKNSSGGSSTP